jgi:hypothetical protein
MSKQRNPFVPQAAQPRTFPLQEVTLSDEEVYRLLSNFLQDKVEVEDAVLLTLTHWALAMKRGATALARVLDGTYRVEVNAGEIVLRGRRA